MDIGKLMKQTTESLQQILQLPVTAPLAVGNALVAGGDAAQRGYNPFEAAAISLQELMKPFAQALPPGIGAPLAQIPTAPPIPQLPGPIVSGGEVVGKPTWASGTMMRTKIY